jgi:hypothetical protein
VQGYRRGRHDDLRIIDVLGSVPDGDAYPERPEGGDRAPVSEVRAAHVMTALDEDACDGGHASTTDADEVDAARAIDCDVSLGTAVRLEGAHAPSSRRALAVPTV